MTLPDQARILAALANHLLDVRSIRREVDRREACGQWIAGGYARAFKVGFLLHPGECMPWGRYGTCAYMGCLIQLCLRHMGSTLLCMLTLVQYEISHSLREHMRAVS